LSAICAPCPSKPHHRRASQRHGLRGTPISFWTYESIRWAGLGDQPRPDHTQVQHEMPTLLRPFEGRISTRPSTTTIGLGSWGAPQGAAFAAAFTTAGMRRTVAAASPRWWLNCAGPQQKCGSTGKRRRRTSAPGFTSEEGPPTHRGPSPQRSDRGTATGYRVIKDEYDNRPDDRDEHAVEIEASDSRRTKLGKEEAADDRANDAEDDIEDETLTCFVDDFASINPAIRPRCD